ncbi:hypothetical protein B0T18DRAFT_318626 [Schizothecium vesticola]|uniref:Uncharacterized protein n=1 Tax=Schizothecium vesticola TaxID=314040 RepID=A0AA40F3W2_9PEZI|nr:hypothetical protein B0T18DRAFT_318626 [Schizothecium vesticola]
MPDLRSLGLEVPRRPSFESGSSVPWETVKHEHDVTGRSSPSSLQTVTTSIVSHLGAWKLEIAGLVLALASMACLVAVVARFDGKPLAAWPSHAITLNALVAVLVTISTAGMGVALASGMGQMKWVRFKQGRAPLSDLEYFDEASRGAWGGLGLLFRMRGGVTGSFGAMIMILAVFMSPFAQQIVAYRFRMALVDSGAVSWRALGYDLALAGSGGFLPVMSMKAAVYDGLLSEDSESRPRLPVECATGNCTFGEIETLAVCQSCVDMSALMTPYCVGGTPPGGDTSTCGWQLPSGAVLNTSADVFSMTPLFPGNINGGSFSTIMRLVFMGVNTQDDGTPKPWALQCSLDTCVQRLRSDVSRGRLTETILTQYANDSVPSTQSAIHTLLPVSITSPVTNETYTMSMRSLQALRAWFADLFRAGAASSRDVATHDMVQSLYHFHLASPTGLQESITRLTTAMTSHIRSSPGNQPVRGHALLLEPYMHIRYAFLVVPATASLAACAFLAMVVFQTLRTGTQLWKTSALAVLFHGLDHDVRCRFSDLEGLEAKREEARAVKVMLEDDGGVGGGGVLRVQRVY